MTEQELIHLLEMIKNVSDEKKEELILKYKDSISHYFLKIPRNKRMNLIQSYNALLFEMGIITRSYLTPEEREKRRLEAQAKPKFTEEEETIRQIFMQVFNEEPYWLKSKKAFSKFRSQGIFITPPQDDSNLNEGYLSFRPKGYSICLSSGLPFFYIYVGDNDLFLYLQKCGKGDASSVELDQKAVDFLIQVQKAFAARTPDAIYLSSYYNEEGCEFLWAETSANFERLISFTDRISSGISNIVSLSDEAIQFLKQKDACSYKVVKKIVEERFIQNMNPTTEKALNELRERFDFPYSLNNSQTEARS